jgi:hypothetical protein
MTEIDLIDLPWGYQGWFRKNTHSFSCVEKKSIDDGAVFSSIT